MLEQTGGTSTLHPEAEGVFVPLRNDVEEKEPELFGPQNDLLQYFEGQKHRGAGATSGLDSADADLIQAVLQRYSLADVVSVDRARLRESHEAWVRVIVEGEERGEQNRRIFRGFGPYPRPGVLTWLNSD